MVKQLAAPAVKPRRTKKNMVQMAAESLVFSALDFLDTDEQKKHWRRCKNKKHCNLCRYIIFKSKWRHRFMLQLPENVDKSSLSYQSSELAKSSWLHVKWSRKSDSTLDVRLGCLVCSLSKCERARTSRLGCYAIEATERSLRVKELASHADSKIHKDATMEYCQIPVGPTMQSVAAAPPLTEFKIVWDAACKGQRTVEQIGQYERINKLKWCIWEAIKEADRTFLMKDGVVITLLRDERQGRLALRYLAVDKKYQTRKGVMGQTKAFGTGSDQINKATLHIVKSLMTKGIHAPRGCIAAEAADDDTATRQQQAEIDAQSVLDKVKVLKGANHILDHASDADDVASIDVASAIGPRASKNPARFARAGFLWVPRGCGGRSPK